MGSATKFRQRSLCNSLIPVPKISRSLAACFPRAREVGFMQGPLFDPYDVRSEVGEGKGTAKGKTRGLETDNWAMCFVQGM